jgi:hypothetical protein
MNDVEALSYSIRDSGCDNDGSIVHSCCRRCWYKQADENLSRKKLDIQKTQFEGRQR